MFTQIRTGLDVCLDSPCSALQSRRLGLLMNQASVNHEYRYACDLLNERYPGQLRALFSPQHGFWGEQQANMIESPHNNYLPLKLPVYSLYSETRRPTDAMLSEIDCLVIDLQDVGTRVYTFVWTLLECLRACADRNVSVVVLDRPNPLGGDVVEGPLLESGFRSFVGGSRVPLRHGLTMGELARLLNDEEQIHADVTVVPMDGWRRSMLFPQTGLPWVMPSPNMPRWETAVLYPGQVLLEGTNLSEGRGTTVPFEVVGAPWLDADRLLDAVQRIEHPGVMLQPVRFRPTFDKFANETCCGLAIHIRDAGAVRSVVLTMAVIAAVREQAPQSFAWLLPPYEYETVLPPIDILSGTDRFRLRIAAGGHPVVEELQQLVLFDQAAWKTRTAKYRLYQGGP
ncbi:MAG: DUF1343 domain-containing protein [Planctomycetaceae bacterium]